MVPWFHRTSRWFLGFNENPSIFFGSSSIQVVPRSFRVFKRFLVFNEHRCISLCSTKTPLASWVQRETFSKIGFIENPGGSLGSSRILVNLGFIKHLDGSLGSSSIQVGPWVKRIPRSYLGLIEHPGWTLVSSSIQKVLGIIEHPFCFLCSTSIQVFPWVYRAPW